MENILREKILNCEDLKSQVIEVPEWGVKVMVKTLTARQRARLLQENMRNGVPDIEHIYPKLVVMSCYDPESGERIFDEADIDALGEKSGSALELIANASMQLSGMAPGAVEAAKND